MNIDKSALPKWQYSKRIPPDWIRKSFADMGSDYEYIGINFSQNINEFMHKAIITGIEAALPSTEMNVEAYHPMTAYDRKVAFMKAAIWHADYCRPIHSSENLRAKDKEKNSELRKTQDLLGLNNANTTAIGRHDVMNDYRQLTKLRASIAESTKALSKQLQDLHKCSDRLGLECMEYEYILNDYENIFNESGAMMHPKNLQYTMTNILNRLEQSSEKTLNYLIDPKVLLGIDLASPASYFVRTLSLWITENYENIGGVSPSDFQLSNRVWSTIATCLLNHDISGKKIGDYINVPAI